MPEAIAAIVLAGGQSSRMGQDKALLPVQGTTLLGQTCAIAVQCAAPVLVVTPFLDRYRAIVPAPCQLVQEQPRGPEGLFQGPAVGLVQGLQAVTQEWVLVLACDLPHLQVAGLQRWQAQIATVTTAIALLPHTEQGWEPLCGFYRRGCLPSLQAFVGAGGRSLQRWLNTQTVQAIAFADQPHERDQEHAMLFNCNTPADLAQVRSQI